jgi:hypothetical protein
VSQRTKRVFRIEENAGDPDGEARLALHDDSDQVVRVHTSPRVLADIAFDRGADEVQHNEDLVTRGGSR